MHCPFSKHSHHYSLNNNYYYYIQHNCLLYIQCQLLCNNQMNNIHQILVYILALMYHKHYHILVYYHFHMHLKQNIYTLLQLFQMVLYYFHQNRRHLVYFHQNHFHHSHKPNHVCYNHTYTNLFLLVLIFHNIHCHLYQEYILVQPALLMIQYMLYLHYLFCSYRSITRTLYCYFSICIYCCNTSIT